MIIAARPGPLSIVAHAVDDGGALCGATATSKWRPTNRLPINCPRCLFVMATPRFVLCEMPTATSKSVIHIRKVGPEGIVKAGADHVGTRRSLCSQPIAWDLDAISNADVRRGGNQRLCRLCELEARKLVS